MRLHQFAALSPLPNRGLGAELDFIHGGWLVEADSAGESQTAQKLCFQRLVELYKKPNLTENEQIELVYVVIYSLHSIEIKKAKTR